MPTHTIIVHTTAPAIGTALVQARRCGYQDAIDAVLERAGDYRDDHVRRAILEVARAVKAARL